jgi:hypothetical protein
VENRESQRPLVRLRRRWEGNIKIDVQEIGLRGGDVDWVDLEQDKDSWRAVVTR